MTTEERSLTVASETAIDVQKERRSGPTTLQAGAASAAFGWDGKVPIQNSRVYRHWARTSEWVKGAINIRKSQVSSAEWDIVPFDQRQRYSKRQAADIKKLLTTPNPANDSFRGFIEPIIEDLLVLDAGCIEKVRSLDGSLAQLWPTNSEFVRVDGLWEGSPEAARYFWYPGSTQPTARWRNEDFIYMMANPRTDSPVGLPPLETLRNAVEAELAAHEYNVRQVANAAPNGIINLGEGFTEQQVTRFREFFESEVAGRGPLGFIGGSKDPGFIKFNDSNRDQQFLEWQIYLVRKIAVVFGLTPQDLGVTFDVNRSTSEIQLQVSEDRGLRPLMSLIQEYFTEEIVWDKTFGGPANNLAFRFTALNLKESTAKAAIYEKALAGVPWRFVNEARIDEGREPIPEMEGKLIMATPQGAVDISDVPTVREIMEAQQAAKQAPSPSAKNIDILAELAAQVLSSWNPSSAPPPEIHTHIDKGAVEVNIENAQPNISVDANTTVAEGAVKFEPTTYEAGAQHFEEGAVQLDQRPEVIVDQTPVVIDVNPVAAQLEELRKLLAAVPPIQPTVTRMEVQRDAAGAITGRVKHMSDGTTIQEIVRRDAAGRVIGVEPKETQND